MIQRRWIFRLLLVALAPLLLLGGIEALLRVIHFGHNPSYLLPYTAPNGQEAWIHNLDYGKTFFPGTQARTPVPLYLPVQKPRGTYRIVVLGGSAAAGDPETDYGLSRILEVLLQAREPATQFEVINAAMTAINSHVVRQIAKDTVSRLEPDAVVLYLGHNEVVGPFGPATQRLRFRSSLPAIRTTIAARRTRLGQAIAGWQESLSGEAPAEWAGMEMFLEQKIGADDPRLPTVYDHFEANLRDTMDHCLAHDARILLCTVPSNLADHAPFASLHDTPLSESEAKQWDGHFRTGIDVQAKNDPSAALQSYTEAASLDAGHAELQYRMGQCHAALGHTEPARQAFARARDLDALRFRADRVINARVRAAAGRYASPSVHLLDMEQLFVDHASGAAPGFDLFLDHVHPTFTGNYLLARRMAEEIAATLHGDPHKGKAAWISESTCRKQLAFTPWDEALLLETLYQRRLRPPWTLQYDADETRRALVEQMIQAKEAMVPSWMQASLKIYEAAVASSPQDWVLSYRAATHLKQLRQFDVATRLFERTCQLIPHLAEPVHEVAEMRVRQGDLEGAAELLREASLPRPLAEGYVLSWIGQACVQSEHPEAGMDWLNRALETGWEKSGVYEWKGRAFLQMKQPDRALEELRRAAELDPRNPGVHLAIAEILQDQGGRDEALAILADAAQQHPYHHKLHLDLARAYEGREDAGAGLSYARRAVELNPLDAEGHLLLATLLEAAGSGEEAQPAVQRAVQLAPEDTELLLKAGNLMAQVGNLAEAARLFRIAAELRPDWILPANNAAWLMATSADPSVFNPTEAVRLAKVCDTLTMHQVPEILDTLSASYAAAGRFDVALRVVEEAIGMAKEKSLEKLIEELEGRRALYQQEERYIQP